jgi:hypothetical protein
MESCVWLFDSYWLQSGLLSQHDTLVFNFSSSMFTSTSNAIGRYTNSALSLRLLSYGTLPQAFGGNGYVADATITMEGTKTTTTLLSDKGPSFYLQATANTRTCSKESVVAFISEGAKHELNAAIRIKG